MLPIASLGFELGIGPPLTQSLPFYLALIITKTFGRDRQFIILLSFVLVMVAFVLNLRLIRLGLGSINPPAFANQSVHGIHF